MPDMPFEVPAEPLFSEDDPLTMTIKGRPGAEEGSPEAGGTFRCLDRANPPLERDVSPETQPAEYLVALLKLQIVEPEREAFEAAAVSALMDDPPRMLASGLIEYARGLGDLRAEAEKALLARTVDRPTRARRASTR